MSSESHSVWVAFHQRDKKVLMELLHIQCEWVDEAKKEKLRTNKYGPLVVILALLPLLNPGIVVEFVRHTN